VFGDVQTGEPVLQQYRHYARATTRQEKNRDARQRPGTSLSLILRLLVSRAAASTRVVIFYYSGTRNFPFSVIFFSSRYHVQSF